jgi:hypothetical protein
MALSVYQGGKHSLLVYSVPKESSGLLHPLVPKEGRKPYHHRDLHVVVYAVEVHKEVIQFLWSMRLDYGHVVNYWNQQRGLWGCPVEFIFFEVLHEEVISLM